MAAHGVNAVRTYTVPPRWLLDLAHRARALRDGRPARGSSTSRSSTTAARARSIERAGAREASAPAPAIRRSSATRSATRSPPRSCAGTAGAGSSASCERLYDAAKDEDPERARHLRQLPEHRVPPAARSSTSSASTSSSSPGPQFESYLARLQNIAGDRPAAGHRDRPRQPLRNAEEAQARALDWQVRTRVRGGLRRDVRVLVDRRVAPRRLRHRGLGLRPRRPRPRARSRRSPPSARRSPRLPFPSRPRLAAHLGRRLRLQQREHAAQLLRRACARSTTRTTR